MTSRSYIIAEEVGQRLDRFISDQLNTISRTMIQKHIRSGAVVVNGKQVKSNYLLLLNDQIDIAIKNRKERELDVLPEKIDLNIIYEDDSIIVINKPAGLVVHPGIGNESGTLVNGLIAQFGHLSNVNGGIRKGIVHRLDADTSGIIIIAKTNDSHNHLAAQFKNRTIKKEYRAVTWGIWDKISGKIDQKIGRSKSNPRNYCVGQNGKNSITNYFILDRYRYHSHVAFMPMTGRTHQIRVHAAWSGHPIFGDEKYGGGMNKCKGFLSDIRKNLSEAMKIFEYHALHAYKLEFKHPSTGQKINFKAPLPDTFVNLLESIND